MNQGLASTHWTCAQLDELVKFIDYRGKTPKKTSEGVPLITAKNIRDGYISSEPKEYIGESDYDSWMTRGIPKAGDVLITTEAPLGNVAQIKIKHKFALAQRAICLQPILEGVENWLLFALRSPQFQLSLAGNATGTTVKGIKAATLKSLEIPLPPLAEQKQIAAKLDELLAQVDTIKTRLDAIPHILKRFRQSVLAAAVSGKLTEEWRTDNTKTELSECESWRWDSMPASWSIANYSELVESRLGKMLDKAKNSGEPTKYLGNINVRWFGFDIENMQEILVSKKEQSELKLVHGDVLICEGGEPGRAAIWVYDFEQPVIFQKALHRARVKSKLIPEWLVFNLKNDCDNKTIEQLFTGTTIKHLTGKALDDYPIRLPPLEEQTEIVRRVEQLFAYADQIEQRVKDAQSRVNHLTQSILAKAFRGELTADWRAQNPDLISGENSAEALLARIRAERESGSGKTTGRKRKAVL